MNTCHSLQKIGSVVPVDLQYSDPDANDVVQLSIADGKDSSLFKIGNESIRQIF